MDEAFQFLFMSISKHIHFHVTGLKNLKEIWDKLADIFDKQDDMRIYRLENELISLHPGNFETRFLHQIQAPSAPVEEF